MIHLLDHPVSMSLFCRSHSFVYLWYSSSVSTGTEARTEVK